MNNLFNMFNGSFGMFGNANKKYNPLINYDWSATTAKEYKTDGVELAGNMVAGYSTDESNIIKDDGELILKATSSGQYIRIVSTVLLSINIKYQIKYNILDKNKEVTFGHSCFSNGTGEVPTYNIRGGENTIYFTPTRDNSYITFIIPNTSIGHYATFADNISVQKVIEEPNKRYLKDVGSTPTYNASMYFGRGAYFNGVDQGITFDAFSPLSENTIIFNINNIGVGSDLPLMVSSSYANYRIMYSYTSGDYWSLSLDLRQFGGNILTTGYILPKNTNCQICIKEIAGVISIYANNKVVKVFNATLNGGIFNQLAFSSLRSQYGKFTIKDLSLFNRTLTQSEITQAYEQPELFYAMAQTDSTCVLNMPMCETDGYARNMKSYSEGSELATNGGFDTDSDWNKVGVAISNGVCNFTGTGQYVYQNKVVPSGYVLYELVVASVSTQGSLFLRAGKSTYTTISITTVGTYQIVLISDGVKEIVAYANGFTGSVDSVSVKEVTGVYPITNYTTSVRDNAKNLQYGLQTCKFVRDSLGVIQSASDYLECDGVGYANTGLVLLENADYTISFVINLKAGVDGAVVSDFGMLGSHKIRRHTNGYMYFIGVLERVVWQVDGDYQAYFVVKFKADGSVEVKKNNSLLISTSYATTYNASNFIIKECSSKLDTTVFRKFIIDDKLTTDEEDTIAFNDAVNKGLLV